MNTMKPAALAVFATFILAACSGPPEDVRIGFCKDLGGHLMHASNDLEWQSMDTRSGQYTDLTMTLAYADSGRSGNVVCVFERDQEQESSLADLQPLAGFASLPHQVSIDGNAIAKPRLAKALHEVMIRRGEDFIANVKATSNKAVSKLSETLNAALQK